MNTAPASVSAGVGSFPVTAQAEVDPNARMSAYANRGSMNGSYATQTPAESGAEPSRVVSYSEMDVDMDDGLEHPSSPAQPQTLKVGTLADSQWATAPSQPSFSNNVPSSYGFQNRHAFGATSQTTSFIQGQTWNSSRSGTENCKPATSQTPDQRSFTSNQPVNALTRALAEVKPEKKLATLKDSRWA